MAQTDRQPPRRALGLDHDMTVPEPARPPEQRNSPAKGFNQHSWSATGNSGNNENGLAATSGTQAVAASIMLLQGNSQTARLRRSSRRSGNWPAGWPSSTL